MSDAPGHADPARLVDRSQFARRLEDVRRSVSDPVAGVFGPSSKLWQVNGHTVMFFASGRAALLQTAHPVVAHGVDQHSVSLQDPIGRFQRTFAAVFDMVFGDLETALSAATRTFAIHSRITGEIGEDVGPFRKGDVYRANDPHALLWVHATLWDSSVRIFEALVRPLGADEKAEYYAETRRFAWLFGIPDEVIPDDWSAFVAYNEAMWASETLTVGQPALEIGRFFLRPPQRWLWPAIRWYEGIVAGLLPARIREQYGLVLDPVSYERKLRWLRRLEGRLPERLRRLPPHVAAMRRIEGRPGRDRVGELLNRALVGRPGTPPGSWADEGDEGVGVRRVDGR